MTPAPDFVPPRFRAEWPLFLAGADASAEFLAWLDTCQEARQAVERDLRDDPLFKEQPHV